MFNKDKKNIFSSNLVIYLREIEKIPLLNDMEEKHLFIEYKNGVEEAKEKIIEGNLRLVINIAKEYTDAKNNILDLIQEGNLALQRAVETYDINKNIKFSNYAYSYIVNKIIDFKRKNHMIRLPDEEIMLLSKIKKFKNEYFLKYSKIPSNSEIAMGLGINCKIIEIASKIPVCETSLNMKMDDNENELQDLIMSPKDDLNDIIIDNDLWDSLLHEEVITPLEKEILIAILYSNTKELIRIEEKYHLSKETVRKKGITSLKKIKAKCQFDIIHGELITNIRRHEDIDINIMEKISTLLPFLKKISSKSFFDMVKHDGIINATLMCFCFGYLDSSNFTIKYIAQLLDIKEEYLRSITSNLSLIFKKKDKVH